MNVIVKLKNKILSEFLCDYLLLNNIIVFNDIEKASGTPVDVIILDNENLNAQLIKEVSDAKIILFDTGLSTNEIIHLLNSFNIHGVISPDMDRRGLLEALRSVCNGTILFNNKTLKELIAKDKPLFMIEKLINNLTEREKEITKLILDGLTNKEIANRLSISEQTVKSHLRSIFKKFNVSSRCQLISLLLKKIN